MALLLINVCDIIKWSFIVHYCFSADEEFENLCFDFGIELDEVVKHLLISFL